MTLLWQQSERTHQLLSDKIDATEAKVKVADEMMLLACNAANVNVQEALMSELREVRAKVEALE